MSQFQNSRNGCDKPWSHATARRHRRVNTTLHHAAADKNGGRGLSERSDPITSGINERAESPSYSVKKNGRNFFLPSEFQISGQFISS
jgi:hypothetical protein